MENFWFIGFLLMGGLGLMGIHVASKDGYEEGYKDGQVDLINGDLWYELKTDWKSKRQELPKY